MSELDSDSSVENLSLRLVEALASFERAYTRWVEAPLQHSGLTYARIRLLGVLNQKGPQIMSALSDELVVNPHSITVLVDALEAAGLVRRLPHPTDRRATLIELTDRGIETCDTMYNRHAIAVSEIFAHLSTGDRRELLRILNLIGAELESRGVIEEFPRSLA